MTYFKLYRWTFSQMRGAERFVFSFIQTFAKHGKPCGCSQAYIAARLNIGISTVKRCIDSLCRHNWIAIQPAGKRKERNAYTINQTKARAAYNDWKHDNSRRNHPLPEAVKVYDWMLSGLSSTQCLLLANLHEIQTASNSKAGLLSDGAQYSQTELAYQCGCSLTQIKDAIQALEKREIITISESNMKWKKARKCYILHTDNIAGNDTCDIAGNDTCKSQFQQKNVEKSGTEQLESVKNGLENAQVAGNDTCKQPEMILVKANKQPEMIPNEYISFFMNSLDDYSAETAPAPAPDSPECGLPPAWSSNADILKRWKSEIDGGDKK